MEIYGCDPNETPSALGRYLQGIQHIGITTNDMRKSLTFYIDILGGRMAVGGEGFFGADLHNLLFQKEEHDAVDAGLSPSAMGAPDLRDGTRECIDVRFISFGNTCLELIHFRGAEQDQWAPNIFKPVPSCVGFANVSHISFFVKDDVDLVEFADLLHEESHKRGLHEVIVNRSIEVPSRAALLRAPHKYSWTSTNGDFTGWSLIYCKGPNGEQIEFNKVEKEALENFSQAQWQYNRLNSTRYHGMTGWG